MKKPFTPLGDRVLIKPIEAARKTASGLEIPSSIKKEMPQEGVVVAVGKGKEGEEMNVSVDDHVFYSKYAGADINLYGDKYLIMRQGDIFGIK